MKTTTTRWNTRLFLVSVAASALLFSARTALATTLVNSNFEPGDPTVWTLANAAATNQWIIGTAASNGGTQGAYVTNDAGVTNAYTITTTSTNHIYTSISVPAGESAIVLSFDWRGVAEYDATTSDFDYLRVSIMAAAPVGGTFPAVTEQLPVRYSGQDNFTRAWVTLPASLAGAGARNIVFTWRNDGSLGFQQPAAIDNVVVTSQTPTPLSGTLTIPGTYSSIGHAIADVNANGADTSGGSLIFNVAAGSTFTETPGALTASGSSATNRIVFQKSGAGVNPKITAEGSGNFGLPSTGSITSTSDGVIVLNGADFVTFDGIDIAINSVQAISPFSNIEYGYLLRNNTILANVTTINSAQNNIVQNCAVTMDRRKLTTLGILQTASTGTGAGSTATSAAQANSNNKYYNYTITNAYSGIYLLGTAAFPDLTCEAGVTGAVTQSTIGSATANDIGNGVNAAWGIRAANQSGVKIFSNEIRNVSASAALSDGILLELFQGSTCDVFKNVIHDIKNLSTSSTTGVQGIRATAALTGTNVGRIYNNFIYGLTSGYTGAASAVRQVKGILTGVGGTTAQEYNIDFNSVRLDNSVAPTISSACFEIVTATATGPVHRVRDNIFANFTGTQTGVAKHYTWVTTSATLIGSPGSISNNNVLHVNNSANGFTALNTATPTDYPTLASWQAHPAAPDANSSPNNPQFLSATNLHINPAIATPVESGGSYFAGAITWVPQDIDNDTRNVTTPDIGADEGTFSPLVANDIQATAFIDPVNGGGKPAGAPFSPQASFTNNGTATQTSVTVRYRICTTPACTTEVYNNTQVIASIASGVTTPVTFSSTTLSAGTYTIKARSELAGDLVPANDEITGTITVAAPLTGTYTVGTAGTFTTLTSAVNNLNSFGVSGPVTLTLLDTSNGRPGGSGTEYGGRSLPDRDQRDFWCECDQHDHDQAGDRGHCNT